MHLELVPSPISAQAVNSHFLFFFFAFLAAAWVWRYAHKVWAACARGRQSTYDCFRNGQYNFCWNIGKSRKIEQKKREELLLEAPYVNFEPIKLARHLDREFSWNFKSCFFFLLLVNNCRSWWERKSCIVGWLMATFWVIWARIRQETTMAFRTSDATEKSWRDNFQWSYSIAVYWGKAWLVSGYSPEYFWINTNNVLVCNNSIFFKQYTVLTNRSHGSPLAFTQSRVH